MNKPFGVIYEIMFPNGKRYIGQSFDAEDRIRHYRTNNCKRQTKLHHALKKYGWNNAIFSILFECSSVEEMNLLEIVSIAQYNTRDDSCGYNIREGGRNGKLSEETKEKLRQANLGKKASEETKKKMSETRKGVKKKPESTAKRVASFIENYASGKNKSRKGEINISARNPTIRYLKNEDGRTFVGTKREFELAFNLHKVNVGKLLRGESKIHKGWSLIQDAP